MRLSSAGVWLGKARESQRLVRWSVLLLPPLLLLCLLALAGLKAEVRDSRYTATLVRDGALPQYVAKLAWRRNWSTLSSLFGSEFKTEPSRLPRVELWVGNNTLQTMLDTRLKNPADRPYFGAYVRTEERGITRCKIASRGLSDFHYTAAKPSLRVKFSKARAKWRRYWDLQRPEDALTIINWLPEQLAGEVGLMHCVSEPVQVFLNNKNMGVYMDSYRAGEPLAIANRRLPGTFFKGDPHDRDANERLWDSRAYWKLFGEPNDSAERALATLLALGAKTEWTPGDFQQLEFVLDLDAYARWCALAILTGSDHADDYHNQTYFFSTYRGQLEPVVWDFNSFVVVPAHAQVDLIFNRIQQMAYHDPRFLHARNRYLYEWSRGLASPQALQERVQTQLERLLPDLERDPNLAELERLVPVAEQTPGQHPYGQIFFLTGVSPQQIPQKVENFQRWTEARKVLLDQYLSLAQVHLLDSGPQGTLLAVSGRVAVKVKSKTGKVRTERGEFEELLLYPGVAYSDYQTDIPKPHPGMINSRLDYRVLNPVQELEFEHALSGQPVALEQGPPRAPAGFSFHPWSFPDLGEKTLEMGPGKVVLERDLWISKGHTLRILPGTELGLGPGVNLFCQGRLEARGTRAQPISIGPAGDEPFGCVGIWGEGSEGTVLEHVTVAGGSTGIAQTVEFKGMLSIYGCPGLRLSDCTIGVNLVGDDAVNLASSQVVVENCRFEQARSDALDLDDCRGEVRDCQFLESGNDGLDLSMSRIQVQNCLFRGCGDKGVSAGEQTELQLNECRFESCEIGLQVKDRSLVRVNSSQFEECGVAVNAYRKKWAFGVGGDIRLNTVSARASRSADLTLDEHSTVSLENSPLRLPQQQRDRVVVKGKSP